MHVRYRGIRGSMMHWCYKNKKLDETLCKLEKSVAELGQMMQKKEKQKKMKKI